VAAAAGVTKLIVYRHFDSKEDLYRAVLESVSARMQEEWMRVVEAPDLRGRGASARAFLTVAREDPDGYRLLVFHAPREPQFEKQTFGYWEEAVRSVDGLLGDRVAVPALREWASRSLMSYLLHAVLLWIETGDPAADEQFVAATGDAIRAMVAAWTADP
jgi:AcrR family transcriptional regulator